jgi:hypothetical protein
MPLLRGDRSRRRVFGSRAGTLRGRRSDTIPQRDSVPQSCSDAVRRGYQLEEIAQRVAGRVLGLIIRWRRHLLRDVFLWSLHTARCARDVRPDRLRLLAVLRDETFLVRAMSARRR